MQVVRLGTGEGTERRGGHDFEEVYREAGPQLWRTLYGACGGRTDLAEEAIAEAFARAIERGDRVRDPIAYVYRVAFRVATQELKREGRTVATVASFSFREVIRVCPGTGIAEPEGP